MQEKLISSPKIADIIFPNNVWLAPLSGFSHKALRLICYKYGAGGNISELISAEGLVRGDKNTYKYIDMIDEPYTIPQLFGGPDYNRFYKASKIIQSIYPVKIIDINAGCPVKKVIKTGGGSALLRNPKKILDIIKALKDSGVSVSIKIRSGFDRIDIIKIAEILERSEVDLITLHPRTAKEMYTGIAKRELYFEIKKIITKKLFASGDIKTPEDALFVLKNYPVDGIMIGRKAIGAPYIFKQILEYYNTGSYTIPTLDEIKACAFEFAEIFTKTNRAYKDKEFELKPIRASLMQFFHNFKGSKELRLKLSKINNLKELEELFNKETISSNHCP